jgi:hydroxymethylglutaryl-CoA synthase
MQHAYDFYKPDFTSEYPVVDGHFSLTCYTRALDQSYGSYNAKLKKRTEGQVNGNTATGLSRFDYSVFHVPTCKLVTKCYARLMYNDYLANPAAFDGKVPDDIAKLTYEESLTDRNVEKLFLGLAKEQSTKRLAPSLNGPTNTGNMYSASVYSSLASLLTYVPQEQLEGKRVSLFSYGSGLAASFFSLVVKGDISDIVKVLDFKNKLDNRITVSPKDYEAALELREKAHLAKNFEPTGDLESLRSGTYYLVSINDKFQREYKVKN